VHKVEVREINYLLTAEINNHPNQEKFNAWTKKQLDGRFWKWNEKMLDRGAGELESYSSFEYEANSCQQIEKNIRKLFELKIEAEAKNKDGEVVAAVQRVCHFNQDSTKLLSEWSYFYTTLSPNGYKKIKGKQ
tara:strand:- start:7 stop:405 length:399 start_codon:yes stop_codon:yes gene_type:complete